MWSLCLKLSPQIRQVLSSATVDGLKTCGLITVGNFFGGKASIIARCFIALADSCRLVIAMIPPIFIIGFGISFVKGKDF